MKNNEAEIPLGHLLKETQRCWLAFTSIILIGTRVQIGYYRLGFDVMQTYEQRISFLIINMSPVIISLVPDVMISNQDFEYLRCT